MDQLEVEGKTVEEAVEAALRQLGRREEEVEVEILAKGSRGLFGLGSKLAKVLVRLRPGGVLPPEAIDRATQTLVRIVELMGMDIEVEAKHFGNELYLEIDQGAGGILIGRHGTTLAALSYLMERIVNHNEGARVKVFVDVAGYLERKRRSLVSLAQEMASEAKRAGREVACGPMSAFERKVIHTTLHGDKEVQTFSRGEGSDRRVVISPSDGKDQAKPAAEDGEGDAAYGPQRHGRGEHGRSRQEGRGGFDRHGRNGGRGRRRGRRGGRRSGPVREGEESAV